MSENKYYIIERNRMRSLIGYELLIKSIREYPDDVVDIAVNMWLAHHGYSSIDEYKDYQIEFEISIDKVFE